MFASRPRQQHIFLVIRMDLYFFFLFLVRSGGNFILQFIHTPRTIFLSVVVVVVG